MNDEAEKIEAAVEQVLEQEQKAPPATDAIVEAWFQRNFPDSPVSRTVEVYNYVRAAVQALKKELAG